MTNQAVSVSQDSTRNSHNLWRWIIFGLIAYAFLYDNSTSLPVAAGYNWTRLLPIPRALRFVELFVVTGCAFLLLTNNRPSLISRSLFVCCFLFLFIGTLSYMNTMIVSIVDFGRLSYFYILPILMFIIGREVPILPEDQKRIFYFVLIWVLISAIVSWCQVLLLKYPIGDDITGLNKDAHANGNLMAIIALLSVSFGLFYKLPSRFLTAIFVTCTMILSSVLKTNIFLVISFGLMTLIYIKVQKGLKDSSLLGSMVLGGGIICILSVFGYFVFTTFDVLSVEKLDSVILAIWEHPMEFRPIAAQINAFNQVINDPSNIFLGTGPFSYGNSISMGQTLEGGSLAGTIISMLIALPGESGESADITFTTSLIVEYGLLAFIIIVISYIIIVMSLWRCLDSAEKTNRAYALGLIGCLLIFFLTGSVTLIGGLDVISVSWPVMLLAGITCRNEAENLRMGAAA